jgi:hypothetical protein
MNVADRQKPAPGELYVDHVSHFVADLDAAARVLESLGIKVTPTSVQKTPEGPVGASNRCVMLEAGYIELLSPTHDTPAAQRMRGLMRRYDGVQLVCYGTPDAEGESRRLQAHGFESQPMLDLERAVEGGTARFKVVRAAPEKMPEGRVQFVQQLTPEHLWRPADVNPLRLDEVFVVGNDPIETAARWARFAALVPRPDGDGVRLETARGRIFIGARESVAKLLGEAPPAPAIAGYSLRCSHPQALVERCRKAGIAVQKHGKRYAAKLPAALGGVWLFG